MSSATFQTELPPGRRHLVTPEGVDLQVELADVGTRIGAFALDLIIIVVVFIAAAWTLTLMWTESAFTLLILIAFFLRSFYFTLFELGRRAATPGKMMMKIRVAARGKARLSAASVFARNALREIGFFLPIGFIFGIGNGGVDGWMSLLAAIWAGVFLFFPLFNKDRLRVGDLVAGTWVVRSPRPLLAADLVETKLSDAPSASDKFVFTPAQIDAYGIKELHVLEDVLRARDPQVVADVAMRIRTKIGWVWEMGESDYGFLKAYYAALRGRLESQMLMGVRRKDKFDTR
ncbi:RDD family protein [Litorimonas sp. WD9-15]|uniref:RDD family protein n=1 Tax=Litorimonas sp. WD9-15 TaxID=3418716 RepID=UPI003CFF6484